MNAKKAFVESQKRAVRLGLRLAHHPPAGYYLTLPSLHRREPNRADSPVYVITVLDWVEGLFGDLESVKPACKRERLDFQSIVRHGMANWESFCKAASGEYHPSPFIEEALDAELALKCGHSDVMCHQELARHVRQNS